MPKATRPPTIRPGQRVPYFKGTQAEIDARRGHIARMLARGMPKAAIHGVVRTMHHRQWRTTDRDISFIISQASQWRERARRGYGRISLYEALVKMKLIPENASNADTTK